ncbi:MAG: hypothetical protein S4CHLAM37_01600 [Chlamydiia bacterium]|nr:hypothetical protein [Chlamydiia bacterium]
MKLRLKLFVYIGCTLVIISVISYLIQDFVTEKNLLTAEHALATELIVASNQSRQKQEKLLEETLNDYRAWINAFLLRVRDFPPLRASFDPKSPNHTENGWLNSATLLTNNKEIDFVETEYKGVQNSIVILENKSLPQVEIQNVTKKLKVVLPPEDSGLSRPLIAIPLQLKEVIKLREPEDPIADFYALFEPEAVLAGEWSTSDFTPLELKVNPLEPYMQWIESSDGGNQFEPFVEELNQSKEQILKFPNLVTEEFVKEHFKTSKWSPRDFAPYDTALWAYYEKLQTIGLTWGFATLITSGPFNNSPFDEKAPIGIVRTDKGGRRGVVLLRDSVFKKRNYVPAMGKSYKKKGYHFIDEINVILPKTRGGYFFGNTLQLAGTDHDFSVTVGVTGSDMMKWVALTLNKSTIMVSNGKIIDAYTPEGVHIDENFNQPEFSEMLSKSHGEIYLKSGKYYYLRLDPFKGENFNFYTLTPFKEAFSMVDRLDENSRELIRKITWQMALTALGAIIILLFLLDRIGSRITGPITMLAAATKSVQEGKLDEVVLPKIKKNPRDEVAVLANAFSNMVKGLQEKEKVRGVLNKVVSSEIADEILKNDVHLGGEEKEVTVFFADIRGFSRISEKMPPQEIVKFLNDCMTRVSIVIDEHHGVIDKYVGDEVMALFGAPIEDQKSAYNAICSALDVIEALKKWNDEREKNNLPRVEMGFGIHKGLMVIGNMGAENRLNYTVVGSSVNLGSRLCGKAGCNEIFVSERVYQDEFVNRAVDANEVDPGELKGFTESVKVYKVTGLKKIDT